tara:strand:- start:387 stop:1217 length:831 start_codon:yes stop_codon:yes gene_type:complete
MSTPNLTDLKTLDRDGCVVPLTKEERELYLRNPKPSRTCALAWDDNYYMYANEADWSKLHYRSQYNHLWLINRLGGIKESEFNDEDYIAKLNDHSDIVKADSDEQIRMTVIKIYEYLHGHYMGAFEYEDGIWSDCIAKAKTVGNVCQYSFKLHTGQWIEVVDWSDCGDLHVKRDIEYLYHSSMFYFYKYGEWLDQSKNDVSTFARTLLETQGNHALTAGFKNTLREAAEYKGSGLKGWINLRVGYAWFIRNYGSYINYKDEHKWLTKILNQVRELG